MADTNLTNDRKTVLMSKIPEGVVRIKGIGLTRSILINDKEITPEKSLKVLNKSPDGFNWGYYGSGPQQLSLAILLRFGVPSEQAVTLMTGLTGAFTSHLPGGSFVAELNLREVLGDIIEFGGGVELKLTEGQYFKVIEESGLIDVTKKD